MIFKYLFVATGLLLVTGCQLTSDVFGDRSAHPAPVSEDVTRICIFEPSENNVEYNCELGYWLHYWVNEGGQDWPTRKTLIASLGDSHGELFKKVLLSQSTDTPYQNRLRAQSWMNEIRTELTEQMQQVVKILITDNSQEILEFESALAILTRLNAQQAKTLEEQELKLKEQQLKLEQLLKIEASIMEKRGGINP